VLAEPGNWAFQPWEEQRAQDEIGAMKKIKRSGMANAWRKMAVKGMLWTPARKIWINVLGTGGTGRDIRSIYRPVCGIGIGVF
jgi:hypothetical protein